MKWRMQTTYGALAGVLLLALGIYVLEGGTPTAVDPPVLETADATPAYRVAIDPVTREFVEPVVSSDAGAATKSTHDPLSRSSEGLVESDNLIAGGKMMHLQGRFQNTFVATVGADGQMTIECETTEGGGSDR